MEMNSKTRLWPKIFSLSTISVLVIFSLFLLCSCGSNGDSGGISYTPQNETLSGTVATGEALINTFVMIRDKDGNINEDLIMTDANGKYTNIDLTAMGLSLPVLIRVLDPDRGWMYSYASSSGTANVHPLTDPIVKAWYRINHPDINLDEYFPDETKVLPLPDPDEIRLIKAVVMDVLENLFIAVGLKDPDGTLSFDPMEDPFEANGTGFDKILDDTEIDMSDETGDLNIIVQEGSELENEVEDTGGSSNITLDTDKIKEADITPPGKPDAPSALRVSDKQILVTWTLMDPNDEAYYNVYRNDKKAGTVTSTVYIDRIDPNISMTYTYRISACDASQNCSELSDPSEGITITAHTALPADTEAPTPGTLSAVAIGFDEIKLTWTGFSDNKGIVGYKVYACSDGSCTTSSLKAKVTGSPFIHFGRSANSTYYYKVTAIDGAGNESAPTDVVSATTPDIPSNIIMDFTPPDLPAEFDANASTCNQIELTWTAPEDDDLAGYYIYKSGVLIVMLDGEATSYTDNNLLAETEYTYWIRAFDLTGNMTDKVIASATTPECPDETPPSVPAGVTATADNEESQITVSWSASTDDDSGVAGYNVFRGAEKIREGTTETSLVDSGLDPETQYCYQVSALDYAGNESGKSASVCATTPAGPPPDVSELINEARGLLEQQDIPGASAKFKQAYEIDPNNKDANFGKAMTDMIMIIEDPNIVGLFETYGTYKPTIENIVYGILNKTYEVWGGNNPICGEDSLEPGSNGYTKLSDANNPETVFTGYDYYVIYAPPFSEVNLSISVSNIMPPECSYGRWIYLGSPDPNTVILTLGGANLFSGTSITISAPNGMTLTAPEATLQKTLMKRLRSNSSSSGGEGDRELPFVNEVKSLFNKLPKNKRSLSTRMKTLARSLIEEPPSPVDAQSLIDLKILPWINGMIANLRKVEGKGYEFTITPAMTGGAETENIILDDGEFCALDAILSGIRCLLDIVTAYDFNIEIDKIEYDPLSQLNKPTFFTLKTGGAAKMADALTALRDVAEKAESAYDFIFNEWGYTEDSFNDGFEICQVLAPQKDPNDNGIQFHDYDAMRPCYRGGPYDFIPDDDSDINMIFDAAKLVLAGPATYTREIAGGTYKEYITDGETTVTLWAESTDEPDGVEFTISADATKFFTNPLNRTDLPTFNYDVPINVTLSQSVGEPVNSRVSSGQDGIPGTDDDEYVYCDIWPTSPFPDLTLNGIFPNGFPEFEGLMYIDNSKTLIMPNDVMWGWRWSEDIEVQPDGNFSILKSSYGPDGSRIFSINRTNGSIIETKEIIPANDPNTVGFLQSHAYQSGEHWALGGYFDSSGYWHGGVFTFSINGTQGQVSNVIPLNLPSSDDLWFGDLASDGTNLYMGIAYWNSSYERKSGVVKFNPATTQEINESTTFLLDTSDNDYSAPYKICYGGGFLWVGSNGLLKVNPSTGEIIADYDGEDSAATLYYNGNLLSMEDQKLLFFVVP
ncbi:MAG: fibronectin type III domain-containing protein [bacterium]